MLVHSACSESDSSRFHLTSIQHTPHLYHPFPHVPVLDACATVLVRVGGGTAAHSSDHPPHHRTSWHGVTVVVQEQWAGTTHYFSCLWTRAGSWDDQALLDHTGSSCLVSVKNAQSEEHWNCTVVGKNYLIPMVARMEIYWWPKSITLRPCKQWYQVRPLELSRTAVGCAQHLPPHGTPLSTLELW